MTRNNIGHIAASMLWSVVLFCLQACTSANLDLCMDEHPHKGQLTVEYDWSDMPDGHPDSMVVVALRSVFRDKVASNWATARFGNESRLYGRYIASAIGDADTYYATYKDDPSRDSLFLLAGEWTVSSYTSGNASIKRTTNYVKNVASDGSSLAMELDASKRLPGRYSYWYDRNPYSSWVDVSPKACLCVADGSVTIEEYANVKKDYKVRLKPKRVSQKVSIGLEAEVKDADITVDSIVCAISGIAGVMNINTLELGIANTYKAVFKTELANAESDRINASATLFLPGLVCGAEPSELQGPGVLNVSVYVHYMDIDNVRQERRLDATTSLYRLLTATPSVKNVNGKAMQACSELDLFVRGRMLISKEKIANASGALDSWTDETDKGE